MLTYATRKLHFAQQFARATSSPPVLLALLPALLLDLLLALLPALLLALLLVLLLAYHYLLAGKLHFAKLFARYLLAAVC
jgi:hypothetical protein